MNANPNENNEQEEEIVSPEVREVVETLPAWDYYQRERRGDGLNFGDL